MPYAEKWIYRMPVENHEEAIKFLEDLTGRVYSVSQLILIGLRRLFPYEKFLTKIVLNKKKFLTCSELVALFHIKFCNVNYGMSLDAVGLIEVKQMCEKIQVV